jgi:crotonobetainyl-CoA:carnitine CoA-transferase CaiB-like acyl-CoA transferase
VFETKDDSNIFIGVVTDALWRKFCELFGLDELWSDETLRENNARVLARERLLPPIRQLVKGFTRAELIEKLEGSGLPFAPIGRPEDMFEDEHLLASGALEPTLLPDGAETRLPAVPISLDGERPGRPATLPGPGADTDRLLADLGFDSERVQSLKASGAVA